MRAVVKQKKRATLMHTYYRSFLLLIVIPLLLVFIGSEIIISHMLRKSALETIEAFQKNVATLLSNDVRTNSLQLSHFVYVNDGEFVQTAALVHNSKGSDKYEADQLLQRAFRTAMVPSQNILVGGFYMKGRGAVYMKEGISEISFTFIPDNDNEYI